LILAHTLNIPEREEACIRRLLARHVDGLFIFPIYRLAPTAAIYDVLWQRQTPTVILGRRAPFCAQFHNVESDDLGGSYQMSRHLLELGHKRIAFLTGPPGAPWAQERLEGYRRALREEQIEPDDRLVFNAGATMEEGAKAALQMLNESVSMTAIQAANDLVAMGAANVFLNQGIKIPDDLSIGGFGNIMLSEHFRRRHGNHAEAPARRAAGLQTPGRRLDRPRQHGRSEALTLNSAVVMSRKRTHRSQRKPDRASRSLDFESSFG
jgi:DNA-binding LacI/PurR family transcriptional regulator